MVVIWWKWKGKHSVSGIMKTEKLIYWTWGFNLCGRNKSACERTWIRLLDDVDEGNTHSLVKVLWCGILINNLLMKYWNSGLKLKMLSVNYINKPDEKVA